MEFVIHPHLITYDTYKCYTWEQLGIKIKHNKDVDKFRRYLKDNGYEIIGDRYMLCDAKDDIKLGGYNIHASENLE